MENLKVTMQRNNIGLNLNEEWWYEKSKECPSRSEEKIEWDYVCYANRMGVCLSEHCPFVFWLLAIK
jgi:hypothetical protein